MLNKLRQTRDPRVLLHLTRVWEEQVQTNLTLRELAALAWRLRCFRLVSLKYVPLPGRFRGAGWELDRTALTWEMRRLTHWLSGGEHRGLRVIAATPTQGQSLITCLRDLGPVPLEVEGRPRLLPGRYLIVPVGTGREYRARLQAHGLEVSVQERRRVNDIIVIQGPTLGSERGRNFKP